MNHGKLVKRILKLEKKLNYYSNLQDEQAKWLTSSLKEEIERLKNITDANTK